VKYLDLSRGAGDGHILPSQYKSNRESLSLQSQMDPDLKLGQDVEINRNLTFDLSYHRTNY